MVSIPESAQALVASPALGHLVTLNPDGSPQATCVWLGLDNGDLVFGSLYEWQKIKNLRRDPRVAVTVESDRVGPAGLREYLIVNGEAAVDEGGGLDLVRRLARAYIGPDTAYPPKAPDGDGHLVRITAHRIGGVGPWATAG